MTCLDCRDRKTCQRLCEKAERYANQDYVPERSGQVLYANIVGVKFGGEAFDMLPVDWLVDNVKYPYTMNELMSAGLEIRCWKCGKDGIDVHKFNGNKLLCPECQKKVKRERWSRAQKRHRQKVARELQG